MREKQKEKAKIKASKRTNPLSRQGDDLSISEMVLLLNAEVHARPGVALKAYHSEARVRNLRLAREKNRRRAKAFALLSSWKTPETYFPIGTARFLLLNPFHEGLTKKLGLFEQAKSIFNRHDVKCVNSCTDLFHAGQQQGMLLMPDDCCAGIAMISASPSSTSNYSSLVAATAPPAAAASSTQNLPMNLFSNISSMCNDQESTTKNEDSHSLQQNQQYCPTSYIYSISAVADAANRPQQHQVLNDLAVDDFVATHPELFMEDRLKWISVAKGHATQYTFERLLQHWAVQEGITQNALNRLFMVLHTFKPSQICYKKLPHDARTFLKVPPKVTPSTIIPFEEIRVGEKEKALIGRYIHFGVEDAILGTSIGLVHRFHYITLLRRIHTVFPLLLPDEFLNLTKPDDDEPYDGKIWANWLLLKTRQEVQDVEPVVFEIKINVDGVQWFESSKVKGIPILGKLVAIRSLSGNTRVKIPYYLAKPFTIGIYEQIQEKPDVKKLMQKTTAELIRLQPDSLKFGNPREKEMFAIEVACFSCDGPMRSDLKGVKQSGWYSCERCRTSGVYLNNMGVKIESKKMKAVRTRMERQLRAETCKRILLQAKERAFRQKKDLAEKKRLLKLQQQTGRCQQGVRINRFSRKRHLHVTADRPFCAVSHGIKRPSAAAQRKKRRLRRQTIRRSSSSSRSPSPSAASAPAVQQHAPAATAASTTTAADNDDEPSTSHIAISSSSRSSTAAAMTSNNRQQQHQKNNKRTAGTAGSHRGSVYFPEIGALPRFDEHWEWYENLEIRGMVSSFILYIFLYKIVYFRVYINNLKTIVVIIIYFPTLYPLYTLTIIYYTHLFKTFVLCIRRNTEIYAQVVLQNLIYSI